MLQRTEQKFNLPRRLTCSMITFLETLATVTKKYLPNHAFAESLTTDLAVSVSI